MNDLIILEKDLNFIDKIKKRLRSKFEMKNLKELQYFLEIQVQRNRSKRQFYINQSEYISFILKRFEMKDNKLAFTSIATSTAFHKAIDDDILINFKSYQSLVDNQMYAMLCTRS